VDAPEYKELKNQLNAAENRLARHLLKLRKAEKRPKELNPEKDKLVTRIYKCREKLKPESANSQKLKNLCKEEKQILRKLKKAEEKVKLLENKTVALEHELQEMAERLANAIRKKSRIQLLTDGCYQLLDLRRKAYMDALRINAANMFRNLHEQYRVIYNNYRDDHARLRTLTRCSGFLIRTAEENRIRIWLPGSLQPHIIEAMWTFAGQIENQINENLTQSMPHLRIELISGPVTT